MTTPDQDKIIAVGRAQGRVIRDIAKDIGMSEVTVSRRVNTPEMQVLIADARQEISAGTIAPRASQRWQIGRPRKYQNPQELLNRAAEYFESCLNEKGELVRPITITGMCNYIGTYRQQLMDYEHGDLSRLKAGQGDDDDFRAAIKQIKSICEEFAEDHMFTARNPAGAIFALKNYGWKDTQTIETTVTEIHTLDPEVRQLVGEYHKQLLAAQRTHMIDVTPRQLLEPQKAASGGDSVPAPERAVDKSEDNGS